MLKDKGKNQRFLLVVLITVFAVVVLFKIGNAQLTELNKINLEINEKTKWLADLQKARRNEPLEMQELEKYEKMLAEFEAQLVATDPYLWAISKFEQDARGFRIRLTNWRRGNTEALPKEVGVPCNVYRQGVTVEGSFHEIGRFVAFLENKYPLLVVQNLVLISRSPEERTCEADLQLAILTTKSEP